MKILTYKADRRNLARGRKAKRRQKRGTQYPYNKIELGKTFMIVGGPSNLLWMC